MCLWHLSVRHKALSLNEVGCDCSTHLPMEFVGALWVVLLPLTIHVIFDVPPLRERYPALQFRQIDEPVLVVVDFVDDYSGKQRFGLEMGGAAALRTQNTHPSRRRLSSGAS